MTGRPKGTPKTGGRKKGKPNKISSALKEAILAAAENAGKRLKPDAESGTVAYLEQIAIQEPASFCSLLGKVLPMTIADTGQIFTFRRSRIGACSRPLPGSSDGQDGERQSLRSHM